MKALRKRKGKRGLAAGSGAEDGDQQRFPGNRQRRLQWIAYQ
jgi:hypothetical protein